MEQTIEITKQVQLQAMPSYKVTDNKASGGALVKTTDGSTANLYIGVAPASKGVNSLRIVDTTGALTLIGSLGCGKGVVGNIDSSATLAGNNSIAATCENAPTIATLVTSMDPVSPAPGRYTFKQEYGTYVN
ncbi:hypothetical protein [Escherichia coli]|uniref:hypothetical protein n=1 Tax=Escherichia coli TaxID=562 RepID=UPI00124AB2A4|nr:hypothetical protein [Escherichia coli]EKJ2867016.1 hypothetical protein [Escherichia coli]HAW8375169.1 hypothetical protein [Escherichia coli]HCN5086438.1 hypothetical protein [Escherichia coli]HCN5368000.1 hypothetical protein [Escherichia coli]HCN8254654.1 hypothetical protein [Escherichia coli]